MRIKNLIVILFMFGVSSICFSQRKVVGDDLKLSMLKNLRFTYQPYEAVSSNCTFDFEAETNDFLVSCDKHQFQVHFFSRQYLQTQQNALEILVMCHRKSIKNEPTLFYSANFWLFTNKNSELKSSSVSLGVDNDTANLNIRFDF